MVDCRAVCNTEVNTSEERQRRTDFRKPPDSHKQQVAAVWPLSEVLTGHDTALKICQFSSTAPASLGIISLKAAGEPTIWQNRQAVWVDITVHGALSALPLGQTEPLQVANTSNITTMCDAVEDFLSYIHSLIHLHSFRGAQDRLLWSHKTCPART